MPHENTAPAPALTLVINGEIRQQARSDAWLKEKARQIYQASDPTEHEALVFQIYDENNRVMFESRNNRQFRLRWKSPRRRV